MMGRIIAGLAAILLFLGGVASGADEAQSANGRAVLSANVQMPGEGFASLGVYDSAGTLIRSLAAARSVSKGPLAVTWDGTTDLGIAAAPGTYDIRGVWFPAPPKVHYLMKVGISGDPPYVLDDGLGGWGGNLGAPSDICSNGKELVATFGCVESNLNTGVQRMDATGKILSRYKTFFGWDGRLAATMNNQNLYLAVMTRPARRLVIGKYDLDNPKGKIIADIPTGEHFQPQGFQPSDRWKGRWSTDVLGLAVDGGKLFVPVVLDNKLFIIAANDGKMLGSVNVPSPRGVAAHDGKIFLLSGTKLLQLDADGKVQSTILNSGLDDPMGLAIDSAGNFYIADRGASQQVKVFSPRGQLLRTIGIKGGRPRNGHYNPAGLLDPRGLCVGPGGDIWVTSSAEDFQRISVWDGQSGALKREFFNTRISADQGKLNPDRSEMVFTNGVYADQPGVSAYKLNWDKGTWYPSWHQDMPMSGMSQPEVLEGNTHIYGQLKESFAGRAPYLSFAGGAIRADNGRIYRFGPDFSIWLFDEQTTQCKLAALVYTHRVKKLAEGRFEGDYDRGNNDWLAWSDLNGDGQMAGQEVRFTQDVPGMDKTMRLHGVELQPDLSLLMLCQIQRERGMPSDWEVKRLAPRQVLPSGVPVYDWSDVKTVTKLKVPSYVGGDGWKGGELTTLSSLNSSGGGYNIFSEPRMGRDVKLRLSGIDGDGWWASRNWRNSPMRFDPATGAPAWLKLGRRAPGKARPGEMYYPRNISAAIDGFCFVDDVLAQTWVWTDKGLYIGRLYNEGWQQIHDANGVFIESTASYVYKVNGKIYGCIGDHGVFIHEVDLPKLTPVDGGSVTLSDAVAAAATPWDPDGPMPGKKPVYVAHTIWDFSAERDWVRAHPKAAPSERPDFHRATITVDGKLDPAEWGNLKPMIINQDDQPVAQVKVTFDNKNLYLAYDVSDPVGFKNAGTELPYSPFTSGAYVDFCLGRDWSVPQRDKNLDGDVRVILAHITGDKPMDYQMGFYPLKSRFAQNPQTLTSPAAQRHFEDISPLPGLTWAWKANDHGYSVEVSVPLQPPQTLGMSLVRNSQVGFDVSVAFANSAGTVRQRASHWAGESETAVVDRPGSAALRPATWGTLVFERSLRPSADKSTP